MKQLRSHARAVVTGLAIALATAAVHAETYPARPVRIVVPFPPGGGIDVLVRALGKELSEKWGQPVIVDNRGGAATFIGAEAVARSPSDGYTLFATTDPTFTSNPHLFKKLPYDPDKDFVPVIQMVSADNIIFAHPDVPAKDLKDMVAIANKTDRPLSFASYGTGTQPQLVFGQMKKREHLNLLHIPYKGIAPVMVAVIAHEVDLSVASAGVAGEMIKAGRIRPLAIAGTKRLAQFPDVPTTAEQGFPYLRSFIWYGLFAPAGTPSSIVDKLNRDIAAILKDPNFVEQQIRPRGLDVRAGTAKEFAEAIKQDTATVGEMVKAADIKPE